MGNVHPPSAIIRKTSINVNGTIFPLCTLSFDVKENYDIFMRTSDDYIICQKKIFLSWWMIVISFTTAPVPFRESETILPNNKPKPGGTLMLDISFRKDLVKAEYFKHFMDSFYQSSRICSRLFWWQGTLVVTGIWGVQSKRNFWSNTWSFWTDKTHIRDFL